ncbi:LysE family translocator [Pseudomonas typographi]|uniref:LysE family translocator n=1 Tax=Pseudomonas typographi TaxID=2715964 RepID=UPI001685B265|nr:LysE family translocator [Pseudomonas typographi]MBD1588695.1 LysE family translocator [Pseudomonas typographi]
MIDGSAVLAVFLVYLAGVVIPGPNFVAVVHKAVAATRSEALALVAGIVMVNLFWATCAISGLGVVFAALPWAALAVKTLGAAYLMWFGLQLLITAGKPVLGPPAGGGARNCRQALIQGVVTNLGNPKSIAFYAAVFSAAAPTHVSLGTFLSMVAVVVAVSMAWYAMVALALSQPRMARLYQGRKKTLDRLCGGLIVALGIRQLV